MKKLLILMVCVFLLMWTFSVCAQEDAEMPLAGWGSQYVGERTLSFVDEKRDGYEVRVLVWYPAVVPEDQQDTADGRRQAYLTLQDAEPDMSGAPYPVVLYSIFWHGDPSEFGAILQPLVSRGFVVVNIDHYWSAPTASALTFTVHRPLDVLFVIDQLALLNEDTGENIGSELAGLMDTDRIGVMGGQQGADTALMVSGARIDTEVARHFKPAPDYERVMYTDWTWPTIAAYHDQLIPTSADDPLWPATTDPRIQAVVPFIPRFTGMFGERGLAEATVPVLLMGPTEGDSETSVNYYEQELVPAFQHLGSDERHLLSLQDNFVFPSTHVPVIRQFVTAFFGYHLQDKTEYAAYLTADYANTLADVVWGIDESAINNP